MKNRDKIKRIVIKIGTSLITKNDNSQINKEFFSNISREIAELSAAKNLVIVSSGAIGIGMQKLNLNKRPKTISEKQAAAAIGQPELMNIYSNYFNKYQIKVAQVLLTHSEFEDRKLYLNASNTLQALLKYKTIPVINENDTVATDEIKFGDNDTLAALVSILFDADLMVLLTDIDGLYANINDKCSLIREVADINNEIEECAQPSSRENTVGGFLSKIKSAKICVNTGIGVLICSGLKKNEITKFLCGESVGTYFYPEQSVLKGKKRYIAYNLKSKGKIMIDAGAVEALRRKGKSLLPSGITEVEGDFELGDCVSIFHKNSIIAKGITNYDSWIIKKFRGKKTKDIKSEFPELFSDEEIIHRDNMVLEKVDK